MKTGKILKNIIVFLVFNGLFQLLFAPATWAFTLGRTNIEANNSMIYVNARSAYIEPATQKNWLKQKGMVIKRRDRLQDRIERIIAKAEKEGWHTAKLKKKIGNKQERINTLNKTIATLELLEKSTQGYSVIPGTAEIGDTYYDPDLGTIVISYRTTSNFVHEVTHAGQFETGDVAFLRSRARKGFPDLFDEVEAYKAEFAYKGTSVGGENTLASSFSEITTSFVKGITISNGIQQYANHGTISIDINSPKADLIKAYPYLADFLKKFPPSSTLKELSSVLYKSPDKI